ncbi:hypothetical protein M427DRAFT_365377 [Gonapodya prolifera JEL478]|uniref:Uncharacterized protein n=1 Tax=Gonapodya prolifera (strain JEL478) TaxID=1344416 RepID=A0A139AA71_GONPJ|nr:hypothetical protein M427DRAFT_365377 [Gonapodya prolifera JEL478]|eukprot:KXS13627.1 hypothetical protein M427DRAFT_365377 [Gonapodya prolifera JEL478]
MQRTEWSNVAFLASDRVRRPIRNRRKSPAYSIDVASRKCTRVPAQFALSAVVPGSIASTTFANVILIADGTERRNRQRSSTAAVVCIVIMVIESNYFSEGRLARETR